MFTQPKGLLLDYGGTLVEDVAFDPRAGNTLLLARASERPKNLSLEAIMERVAKVTTAVAARRDHTHVETPWPTLTRLIYEFFGVRFTAPWAELELAFWQAAVTTRPMPGARDAFEEFHRRGIPTAVVSNCSFGPDVLRYELGQHGLAERLAFIMVSAEYAVRKPHPLLFETAAAKLGIEAKEIWFVGDRLDTDMAGAKAAGMTAVWFCSANSGPSDGVDLMVTSWSALVQRFQSAG